MQTWPRWGAGGALSRDLWAREAPSLLSLAPGTICSLGLSHIHMVGITPVSMPLGSLGALSLCHGSGLWVGHRWLGQH